MTNPNSEIQTCQRIQFTTIFKVEHAKGYNTSTESSRFVILRREKVEMQANKLITNKIFIWIVGSLSTRRS